MRTVLMVLFDQVQSLDVTGPLEVFTGANTWRGGRGDGPAYDIRTASLGGRPVRTSSGLRVTPDEDLREVRLPRAGLLIVPGGEGSRRPDPELTGWLRAHGRQADRLVSVCTGAFLLAEAGLLDGRRATTHWACCASLADRYPRVTVEPDPIFVRDGNVCHLGRASPLASTSRSPWSRTTSAGTRPWTSPGSWCVFLRRPANQAQFSAQLATQLADRDAAPRGAASGSPTIPARTCRSRRWPAGRPVPAAASPGPSRPRWAPRPAATSSRSGSRRPGVVWRTPTDGVEQTARSCGFGTRRDDAPRLRPRPLGVSPGEYRRRFRPAAIATESVPTKEINAHRHPAVRPVHLPRRDRPLRGAQRAAGRRGLLRRRTTRAHQGRGRQPGGYRTRPGCPTCPVRTSSWCPAVRARTIRCRTARCTSGSGPPTRRPPGPRSVCTGSLILAAAGLLTGRRATTHWLALDELGQLGATPVTERVVFDGKYVTAAGVSAGIDMGLALAWRISGDQVAQSIQLMIEYDPQPPYDAGSPDRAPPRSSTACAPAAAS